jgi:hypothetical protein
MKSIGAAVLVLAASSLVWPSAELRAQGAASGIQLAQAGSIEEPALRRIRRPTSRLRVYPNYQGAPEVYPRDYPGPNAVRECSATYVQEYRPSGTVIVPRMSCHWRPG